MTVRPAGDDEVGNEVRTQVGGWAMVPNWVLGIGLTPGEFAIYVAMRSFADRNGECYPTAKKIAERALGASVKSVHNAFSKFRKLGIITTETRERPDGSTAGLYIVMTDLPPTRTTPSPNGEKEVPQGESQGSPHSEGSRENTPSDHPTETPTTSPRERAEAGAVVLAHPAQPPSRRAPGQVTAEAREVTMAWMEWAKTSGKPTVQKFPAVMKLCEAAIANGSDRNHVASALAWLTGRQEVVTTQSLTRALANIRGQSRRAFRRPEDQDWADHNTEMARALDADGRSAW